MNNVRYPSTHAIFGLALGLLFTLGSGSPATSGEASVPATSQAAAAPTTSGAEPPAGEERFLSRVRQLTLEGRKSGEAYFSPDGRRLIFQSEREAGNPFYQIYTLDLETGDSRRVSPGIGKTTCAFFRPGSDEVLYASTHHDPEAKSKMEAEIAFRASGKERRYSWDYDAAFDIFASAQDGTHLRRLTDARGYDAEGAWSPDGKLVVFCSLRDAYPNEGLSSEDQKRLETDPAYFGEIYTMEADGSGQRRMTKTPGYDGGPFFSPDGDRIVWRRFEPDGVTADVFTMKTDGGDERRLTRFACMSWAPYFHPSGEYVIFTANKLGFANFELFLVDALGAKEPVRVSFTDGFDGLPVFSPDGAKLAWTSNRTAGGASQIFLGQWKHAAAVEALRGAPPAAGSSGAAGAAGAAEAAATEAAAATAGKAPAVVPPVPPDAERAIAGFSPAIDRRDLQAQVTHLASPALEGRATGSAGSRAAADYLARCLSAAGVKPVVDSYFQDFDFTAGIEVVPAGCRAEWSRAGGPKTALALDRDFRPLAFSTTGEAEGELVFAGYGLRVPGDPGTGYDSYAGLDVTGKVALVLRYVPEGVDPKRRAELNRYAGLRYKAMVAREKGARAVIFVTGPNSPGAGELLSISFDSSTAPSGILAGSTTLAAAEAILASAGKDLKALQTALDTENPHASGTTVIDGVQVSLAIALHAVKKVDRNVIGLIEASAAATTASPSGREYILVGAHYDHLGFGESGAMHRPGEEAAIHFGADDNASGTALVLELAAALAAERASRPEAFRRGVILAFWSGEEMGLIGSSWFAEKPLVPLAEIAAYVNFDMVGRLRLDRLSLQGAGSSGVWRKLAEKQNVPAGFALQIQDDPYLPTDVTAFYPKGVPVLSFFTGGHDDYHRPTDTADKLDYEGIERIAKFARGLVLDLAAAEARPELLKVEGKSPTGGARDNLRVYLGTIPDYASEVAGVKLSGVRAGGPAEKAGLLAGDVIVEFGGQKIANIYDYTYALDAAKVGVALTLVVERKGERLSFQVVPEVRK